MSIQRSHLENVIEALAFTKPEDREFGDIFHWLLSIGSGYSFVLESVTDRTDIPASSQTHLPKCNHVIMTTALREMVQFHLSHRKDKVSHINATSEPTTNYVHKDTNPLLISVASCFTL